MKIKITIGSIVFDLEDKQDYSFVNNLDKVKDLITHIVEQHNKIELK